MESLVAQIDYSKVEPIPFKKTVAYVNHFVIQTTQFLNRFSFLCEQRLDQVSRHLQRLEITMNILEAKLNSIPEDALGPAAPGATTAAAAAPAGEGAGEVPPPPPPREEDHQQQPHYGGDEYQDHTALPPPGSQGGGLTVSADPRYEQYFVMLRLRVPVAAIKQKMMLEGINPDILDNPDAPSDWTGGAGGAAAPRASGGEYFSDDDDDEEESDEGW